MKNNRHYNPVIQQQLVRLITEKDWEKLRDYLNSLSNANFRRAGYILEDILSGMVSPDAFWDAFSHVVMLCPKAFLITLLRSAIYLYEHNILSFEDEKFHAFARVITDGQREIDRHKVLLHTIPHLRTPEEIAQLFMTFEVDRDEIKVKYLLHATTIPAYFLLFKIAKSSGDNIDFLSHLCGLLKQKGDDLSFNVASLLKAYFGLTSVSGIFSLDIPAYSLSRLDQEDAYGTFRKLVTSI